MGSTDPRQPDKARQYTPPAINPQDLPPDYSSLLAIVCGIAGVMLRSLANMKNAENDLKQVIMAATFGVMGLVTNYMGPSLGAREPAK